MRGRMNDVKSYVAPVAIGEVMVGQTVGEVVESRDPALQCRRPGAHLARLAAATASRSGRELTNIDTRRAPASYYLGVLGMPGMTAWFGLLEIGQPKPARPSSSPRRPAPSAASWASSRKIAGCRVVGIAGGKAKCDYVVGELGFDACIDYKAGNLLPGPARRSARRASTCTSRTSAARCSIRCCAS